MAGGVDDNDDNDETDKIPKCLLGFCLLVFIPHTACCQVILMLMIRMIPWEADDLSLM